MLKRHQYLTKRKQLCIFALLYISMPASAQTSGTSAAMVFNPATGLYHPQLQGKNGCIGFNNQGRFLGWIEHNHCALSYQTEQTAQWLDRQLGSEVWQDDEQANMQVRAVLDNSIVDGQGLNTHFKIRAKVNLPNTQNRLKLIFSDDAEDINNQNGNGYQINSEQVKQSASLALRWTEFESKHFVRGDIDIGARGIDPVDVFLRGRLSKTWGLSHKDAVSAYQTVKYGTNSQLLSLTEVNIERLVDQNSVARLANTVVFEDKNSQLGLQWAHGLSLSHQFNAQKAALSYGLGVNGNTKPSYQPQNYGVWLQYRQSFWRNWLYYQVEPQVNFPRSQNWDATPALFFRVEALFGKY